MGVWYKIPRDSKTGKRLQAIQDRRDAFSDAWVSYRQKYHIKSASYHSGYLCDVAAMIFAKNPDETIWHKLERGDFKGYYQPIKGTEAYREWLRMRKMRVQRHEIDRAMGAPTDFPDVGIHWGNEKYFFVHYRYEPSYTIGEECVPISNQEYRRLTGDKSLWV